VSGKTERRPIAASKPKPRVTRSERRRRSPQENDEMVFGVLAKADKPLTAYALLGRLRNRGITAPPTIYRALDRLIRDGRAHRLESLNAFVACARPHHRSSAVFAICRRCGTTAEFADAKLAPQISGLAKRLRFHADESVLEIRGECANCKE
jgi:Fur family transcriptional regulator, zinc uptake regulator